jgi:2-methylcitrate dehydratase PrpD
LSYLQELAAFASGAALADLPPAALARTRWLIADSLPVIAAGMQQPEMRAWSAQHLAGAAGGKAWLIGSGRRVGVQDAALLNGTAGTWLELNEGNLFAKGHPGIQVVPAAVALAQELGASGEALLMAVAVGYDVCSRISRAAQVRIEVHPHGTWGVIGAAIAAGRLLGFDEGRMRELINVASTLGLATSRQTLLDGSTVRNIFTGHSGAMGLSAARLVQSGFTGERDSPAAVYGKVLSDGFDPARVVEGLGREWLIEQGYFKLHPTGRYVHSAIDALDDLLARHPRPAPEAIERMQVKAYRLCAMLKEKRVTSSFGARFSVPFALATILHHGASSLAAFEDQAVNDPAIQALAARIEVEEVEAYTRRYPQEQVCELRMVLRDGSTLEGRCTITKGEPSKPHSAAELEAKFLRLGVPAWGEPTARRLLASLLALETVDDFGRFSEGFAL